ncbi:YeeE/YedE family protein [Massilia sp. PAMC28688]|uniref:YeeE/YedE family protein n=1 Tax=Massilia sp. PAMC28688 TaxID=2861283 RepID=UPI001C629F7F|nr:YeeE/YedE family protein [Massilia sp. PAMC28688]QYF93014.1 YeeE/YedE family protein [Massilia sp. PAMC28688]
MSIVFALLSGLLFGLGLIVSGMSDPAKVLGFLDLAGKWDPSLAFVMGGAILIGSLVFPFATKQEKTILGSRMRLPTTTKIDRRLVVGGLTFGVGWGLAGYCPGPALASLVQGGAKPWVFVIAMLGGMALFELIERSKGEHKSKPA